VRVSAVTPRLDHFRVARDLTGIESDLIYSGEVRARVLWRYCLGVTPTMRTNERRMASALPNPQAAALFEAAICSLESLTSSFDARCKIYCEGDLPNSRGIHAQNCGLITTRSARTHADNFFRKFSMIQS
jgi:hypothetical protein